MYHVIGVCFVPLCILLNILLLLQITCKHWVLVYFYKFLQDFVLYIHLLSNTFYSSFVNSLMFSVSCYFEMCESSKLFLFFVMVNHYRIILQILAQSPKREGKRDKQQQPLKKENRFELFFFPPC